MVCCRPQPTGSSEPHSQATQRQPDSGASNSHSKSTRPPTEETQSTPPVILTVTHSRRVVALEKRDVLVNELAAKLDSVQWDLILSEASVSGLSALQYVPSMDKWALGVALQGCLRAILMVRVKACPPRRTARTKRNQTILTIDHVAVCGAVDQLAAMCRLEVESTGSAGGRVDGRVIHFLGVVRLSRCCLALPPRQPRLYAALSGERTVRCSQGRYSSGMHSKMARCGTSLSSMQRMGRLKSPGAARPDAVLQPSTGGPLVRATVSIKDMPGFGRVARLCCGGHLWPATAATRARLPTM